MNTQKIKNTLKVKIASKMVELEALVDGGVNLVEALTADQKATSLIDDIKAYCDFFNANKEAIKASSLLEEINDLYTTLKLELVYCPKKYVVYQASQSLTSPSGFHPSDRVFIQPLGAVIHTDSLDNLPSTNYKMVAVDIDKIAA